MKGKHGFEFSFGWIFAIVVGAAILSLAIYAAVKIVGQERDIQQTIAGKEIGIILSPIETSLEGSKASYITFPVRTRVFNDCDNVGFFGTQKISTSIESGIGKQWVKPSTQSRFYNKYLFSSSTVEGKTAIVPRNNAPINKTLFKIEYKKLTVEDPGLMPGINPPIFCKFEEMAFGSKVTAV